MAVRLFLVARDFLLRHTEVVQAEHLRIHSFSALSSLI